MKKPAIQAVSLGSLKCTVARSRSYLRSYQYPTKVCFMRCTTPLRFRRNHQRRYPFNDEARRSFSIQLIANLKEIACGKGSVGCPLPIAIALVLAHAAVIGLLWTTQRMLPHCHPKDLPTLTAVVILYQIMDIKYPLAMFPPMIQLFKTYKMIRLNFGRVLIQCRIPFLQTPQLTVQLQMSSS